MTVLSSVLPITAVNFKGIEDLVLPFATYMLDEVVYEPSNDDKYFVKSITGIEPPEQNVAIAKTASGGKYQGKTSSDREIVALIGINPDWDAGETPQLMRNNLYTMLSTGYDPKVVISLMSGNTVVGSVVSYVSKVEVAIFSKDPALQITFECLDPVFTAPAATLYLPSDLDEKNPHIYNHGTAETGFKFAVKFTDDVNGWFIKQADNQNIGMTFDMQFHANDILAVSTIPGKRYIHWNKHRGKVQNKMSILTNDSEWLMLYPGMNHFNIGKGLRWDWSGNLSFTAQFWGV